LFAEALMRRFMFLFVLVPLTIVVVVLSVANRGAATFSLDPFDAASPLLSLTAPLFVFLFAALAIGVLIGGIAAWTRQSKWRRTARSEKTRADRLAHEVDRLNARVAAVNPPLPAPNSARDAA
jgi:uncharacterized integral membrane protein